MKEGMNEGRKNGMKVWATEGRDRVMRRGHENEYLLGRAEEGPLEEQAQEGQAWQQTLGL